MLAHKLNLPLPEPLHAALFREAKRSGRPATHLVREALSRWLAERERERVAAEIARFAAEHAGTEIDLDPGLEAAAVDALGEGADDTPR